GNFSCSCRPKYDEDHPHRDGDHDRSSGRGIGRKPSAGGNITGLTRLTTELSGKRLEIFKEAVPSLSIVGVLRDAQTTAFRGYEIAAAEQKLQFRLLDVRNPKPDIDGAFQLAVKQRVDGHRCR